MTETFYVSRPKTEWRINVRRELLERDLCGAINQFVAIQTAATLTEMRSRL